MNIVVSFIQKKGEKREKGKTYSELLGCVFRERECGFSLGFRVIRQSEFFGARKKVALRSEAYVWAPVLRSFDKLCEVGVSSYLKLQFV